MVCLVQNKYNILLKEMSGKFQKTIPLNLSLAKHELVRLVSFPKCSYLII